MKRSWIWATLFAIAATAWLASGEIALPFLKTGAKSAQGAQRPAPAAKRKDTTPFRVEVVTIHVRPRRARLKLPAHTASFQTVQVRARTSGIVEETPFAEGARVKKGDVLCRIGMDVRTARLQAARATVASARRDYEAGIRLLRSGHMPQSRLKQLKALYDKALAQLRQYEQDIEWTKVRAPIGGILARQLAKKGDLLSLGKPCAEIVKLDPLKVIADVSEREVGGIETGNRASAELVTGETLPGTITYIAPDADPATRTFRLEMTAANPGGKARAGVTASLVIPLPARPAALVPLAAIGLDDNGVLGIHHVGKDNRVIHAPVKVLEETRQGAWVSGLPDGARVIVSGRYYVLPGQKVTPVPRKPGKENPS